MRQTGMDGQIPGQNQYYYDNFFPAGQCLTSAKSCLRVPGPGAECTVFSQDLLIRDPCVHAILFHQAIRLDSPRLLYWGGHHDRWFGHFHQSGQRRRRGGGIVLDCRSLPESEFGRGPMEDAAAFLSWICALWMAGTFTGGAVYFGLAGPVAYRWRTVAGI